MTREELKTHCEKQIEMCEVWAISRGEKPSGKVYEEHKLILELLEQESVLDKIKAEFVSRYPKNYAGEPEMGGMNVAFTLNQVLQIIDKYKVEK